MYRLAIENKKELGMFDQCAVLPPPERPVEYCRREQRPPNAGILGRLLQESRSRNFQNRRRRDAIPGKEVDSETSLRTENNLFCQGSLFKLGGNLKYEPISCDSKQGTPLDIPNAKRMLIIRQQR
ncbi:hypothetical protein TNCV_3641951 [Trichonephila clavipes]|nr:hypothetical protein TNCV_3641951 [Trichonephila clavipes]